MWQLFLLVSKGRVGLVMKDRYTYANSLSILVF
jgi:hypothetical protein